MTDRRTPSMRRDLNDLIRSPDGKVAEAKGFAVVFKVAMLYVFVNRTEEILAEWTILALFIAAFLAPDLLKKIVAARLGAPPGTTERTEYSEHTKTIKEAPK